MSSVTREDLRAELNELAARLVAELRKTSFRASEVSDVHADFDPHASDNRCSTLTDIVKSNGHTQDHAGGPISDDEEEPDQEATSFNRKFLVNLNSMPAFLRKDAAVRKTMARHRRRTVAARKSFTTPRTRQSRAIEPHHLGEHVGLRDPKPYITDDSRHSMVLLREETPEDIAKSNRPSGNFFFADGLGLSSEADKFAEKSASPPVAENEEEMEAFLGNNPEQDSSILMERVALSHDGFRGVPFISSYVESIMGEALSDNLMIDDDLGESSDDENKNCMHFLVKDGMLESCSIFVIWANIICIVVELDFQTRHDKAEMPIEFYMADVTFTSMFALEISLRLLVYRWKFFTMIDWEWNIFDLITTALQVGEELLRAWLGSAHLTSSIFRAFRLLRFIRVFRLASYVEELRTIINAICESVVSVSWIAMFVTMLIFALGLFMTQAVHDHMDSQESPDKDALFQFFGTLDRTMGTLFACIADGFEWREAQVLLSEEVSCVVSIVFSLYIGFTIFALMNTVTGMFCERAMRTSQDSLDARLARSIIQTFQLTDKDNSGQVTMSEFEQAVQTPKMKEYFRAINLDVSEATNLFHLLDCDDSGSIDIVEFMSGCLKLRGAARALDLAALTRESSKLSKWTVDHITAIERKLTSLCKKSGVEI